MTTTTPRRRPKRFKLDLNIPVITIMAFAIQALGLVWMISAKNASNDVRMNYVEQQVTANQDDHDRLARIETVLNSINERLDRQSQYMQRIEQNLIHGNTP